jgi:hypothetical protein
MFWNTVTVDWQVSGNPDWPPFVSGNIRAAEAHFISMPLGELWAIRRSTGVANVIGGATVPVTERIPLFSECA